MTGFLTVVLVWYIIGTIGCCIAVTSDIRRGIDFTIWDLMLCVIGSFLGFVMLIIGVFEYSKYNKIPTITLIKGKK